MAAFPAAFRMWRWMHTSSFPKWAPKPTPPTCESRAVAAARALDSLAVVDASADGRVNFATAKAREFLDKYFCHGAHERLPACLVRWCHLQRHSGIPGNAAWIAQQGDEQLAIRVAGFQEDSVQLLFEQKHDGTVSICLRTLGLTPREAEVLLWIARGKTNRDIGMILQCQARTVCKHTERIFTKLAVETRTAAAAIAMQWTS